MNYLFFLIYVSVFATNLQLFFCVLNVKFCRKYKGKGLNPPFNLLSFKSFKIPEILQVLFKSLSLEPVTKAYKVQLHKLVL